jgi:hypothetical protein
VPGARERGVVGRASARAAGARMRRGEDAGAVGLSHRGRSAGRGRAGGRGAPGRRTRGRGARGRGARASRRWARVSRRARGRGEGGRRRAAAAGLQGVRREEERGGGREREREREGEGRGGELTSGSKSGDHRLRNLGHHGERERDGRERRLLHGRIE